MTPKDTRYDPIAHLWPAQTTPPIGRTEAERAARRIYRHFGAVALGGPLMTGPARFDGTVRRCWISSRVNAGLDKGWQRLVHDVSHEIFARRHPNFRPHAGGHAVLERCDHQSQPSCPPRNVGQRSLSARSAPSRAGRLSAVVLKAR